jgi:hypothetical protein
LPAPPASYWTRVAPPRLAAVGRTDAGKWRRSAAGIFSALRCRVLLPLRPSPSPSSSSLHAGELPPSPMDTTQTRRWIRIKRQRTDSGDLSDLTHRSHLSGSISNVSRPGRSGTGPAHSGFFGNRPGSMKFGPKRFYLFPAHFKYVSDMIFKL